MSRIEMGKTYRTRDGREVRIYAVDGRGEWPVHGAVKNPDGECHTTWRPDGRWCSDDTPSDLIEVRPRIQRKVWVNVYHNGVNAFRTREYADEVAREDRIACVEIDIDVEEGHGL